MTASPDRRHEADPDGKGLHPREQAITTAAAVQRGERDPVQVVDDCIARIRARDERIRAFVHVRADEARAEAAALRGRADLASLPLAGVPIGVKDLLPVAGLPTGLGSAAVRAMPAAASAEVVRRLHAAGAIVVGLTTLPELGTWATTDGPFGVTRNPRDPARTPGGSSGGSAAAVAAGMVPLALGTDGLGSIRIPAAACGVVGFKPSPGLVPDDVRGGDWHGMTATGPLAATVADVALATAVMAGRPELARADVHRPLLIALSTRTPLPGGAVDPQWERAVGLAGEGLERAGHNTVRTDPPYSPLYALPLFARWFGGVAAAADALACDPADHLPDDPADHLDWRRLQRRTRAHIRLGRLVHRLGGPRDGLRDRWIAGVDTFFRSYDVLITPALAHPPIRARRWARATWIRNIASNTRYAPFAAPWNLAGTPAGVVPAGTHSNGTPLAVQVVAAPGNDHRALAGMRAVERVVAARRA